MDKKTYVGSKILIIVLSLIISLNGLGLVVAGKKTNNKKWLIFGIGYIVVEWICFIIGSDICIGISLLASIICIIHTALILGSFGELLNEKNSVSSVEVINKTSDSEQDAKSVVVEERVNSIRLPFGKANIEYREDGKAKITISSKNEYEFISDGRSICEAIANDGTICKYEGGK